MREILFRGKRLYTNSDGNEGEWVNGHLASHDLIAEYEPYGVLPYHTETAYAGFVEVDPETVGQYTGLTDRNGKEIFEGDIVKVFGMIGEVVQECGAFGIHIEPHIDYDRLECEIPNGNNADFCFNDNFISLWELWWNYQQDDEPLEVVEVIGNIYDNPELRVR